MRAQRSLHVNGAKLQAFVKVAYIQGWKTYVHYAKGKAHFVVLSFLYCLTVSFLMSYHELELRKEHKSLASSAPRQELY